MDVRKGNLKAWLSGAAGNAGPHLLLLQLGPQMSGLDKRKMRNLFHDLYPEDQATELEMRAVLLEGLKRWLGDSEMTRAEIARRLGITQGRLCDIGRGRVGEFSLGLLVRLASRAGLQPKIRLTS